MKKMKKSEIKEIKDIENLKKEILRLRRTNAEVTKSGNWFTDEQVENEKKIWYMTMTLRFRYHVAF
jgi:hypothetical protein